MLPRREPLRCLFDFMKDDSRTCKLRRLPPAFEPRAEILSTAKDLRKKEVTAGPVSRILSACLAAGRTVIPLGRASLPGSSDLPGGECAPSQHADARGCTPSRAKDPRWGPRGAAPSLFGLAPCGVCPARSITGAAVRSYRTFSPLPRRSYHPWHSQQGSQEQRGGMFSVALSVGMGFNPSARTLSGTLLCGVRTFLP